MDAMGGMGNRFAVGTLGAFVLLWFLMMAAMMFPSAWPAVAVFTLVERRRPGSTVVRSAAFVLGYLTAWTAIGVAAFGLLALVRRAGIEHRSAADLARYVIAPVALSAALYQLAPLKKACLRHCRGPLSFFMSHWRHGIRGAFRMGVRHGSYCVGCCWVLMVVLLTLGVMSVAWMAAVSVVIAAEKLAPAFAARFATRAVTASLLALAVVAVVKPGWVSHPPGMQNEMSMH
jgi:predicted metal-binding membrane protein